MRKVRYTQLGGSAQYRQLVSRDELVPGSIYLRFRPLSDDLLQECQYVGSLKTRALNEGSREKQFNKRMRMFQKYKLRKDFPERDFSDEDIENQIIDLDKDETHYIFRDVLTNKVFVLNNLILLYSTDTGSGMHV